MEKQKPEIIRDNKKRGEWAESVFAARAAENGLAVSKPSGDSESFDYVVGHPGKFVGVQVKCTIAKQPNAKGYICNLKSIGLDLSTLWQRTRFWKTRGTSCRRM
jgi:PD-(D/E)XK nuclease superfamily protein